MLWRSYHDHRVCDVTSPHVYCVPCLVTAKCPRHTSRCQSVGKFLRAQSVTNAFGGHSGPLGSFSAPPDSLAAIGGGVLLLRWRQGREGIGRKGERDREWRVRGDFGYGPELAICYHGNEVLHDLCVQYIPNLFHYESKARFDEWITAQP